MARRALGNRGQWLQVAATVLFAGILAVLLVLGLRRATALQSTSTALQLASELRAQPEAIRTELTLIQRELETQTYVGQSQRNLVSLRSRSRDAYAQLQQALTAAGLQADAGIAAPLTRARERWQTLGRELDGITGVNAGTLYTDSANGSTFSASGRRIKSAIDDVLTRETGNFQIMTDSLSQLGAALRNRVDDNGHELRSLQLAGAAVAVTLLVLMLYFGWRSRRSARAAADAQRQVANILGTVREGLFLVGRDLKLGATCSDSLAQLLHTAAPAGRSFDSLLETLVDEKTAKAALKFLGLLWKDKVHEELIESVNPLSQVEVNFTAAHGGTETRFLAFSFRRVRGSDTSGDYILGVVADVTDRVLLTRELEHVRADSDSQAALLLQLLQADPGQLQAFLSNSEVALRKSNAMLTAPGQDQDNLKQKLNGVFRELHTAKGEAGALGLGSFVQRIHAIEDILAGLRARASLSGNDFMPVVVKLDELLTHSAAIQHMQERMAAFRGPGAARLATVKTRTLSDEDSHADTTVITQPAPPAPGAAALEQLLQSMAQEVAQAQGRPVRLVTRGLEEVPAQYAGAVRNICIQMIRNSIVHGIESPELRVERGKRHEGTLQISFATDSVEDYLLTIEDDGCGLNYEQIVDRALRLGLVRPQQAMSLERAAIYRLIFQPGFSTAEQVSEHAGRGVGLDAVSGLVREHSGKIGVSTVAGKYTRFKVLLPKAAARPLGASSAA